jgi:hypothetical protein
MTEEWAEAMRMKIENEFAKANDAMEELFSGGSSFDTIRAKMDMLDAQQEDYLTKTNQVYETEKLAREAAMAADKAASSTAKAKLKAFEDETKALQTNTKLSQLELDLQRAKYEELLAEIALEDAQNAKSTVRLTQDSEGNFGYVYTAD